MIYGGEGRMVEFFSAVGGGGCVGWLDWGG